VMEEPREGRALLVGAVLVENDGVEDVYEARKSKIHIIVVGKGTVDGREEAVVYRLMTDENGYFFVPNVPPGSYVVKGIELDLGYGTRLQVTSRWEGNTQIYYPAEGFVDHVVRVWPPPSKGRIINLGIRYFRVDASYRIYNDVFDSLDGASIALRDVKHTMPSPIAYYKAKYPDS
ncbi:MAG: carboxypeptidase-like regulatory domain-containing protein, partial [candidate division KSB1 bacterium]|nr:carboxypeptidase-like regulatory domain-containing protein [candidate division KSB1 bacterium]